MEPMPQNIKLCWVVPRLALQSFGYQTLVGIHHSGFAIDLT